MALIDETGNRYGKLTVIEKIRRPNDRKTLWRCLCDCGNEIICSGSDLRTHRRSSCGRHCNAIKDETGKTYGQLTVLKKDLTPASEFPDKSTHWICKCNNCGSIVSVSGRGLRKGLIQSCGCIRSLGERNIKVALNQLKYNYLSEYTFDDLISPFSSKKLRFDFAIFKENNQQFPLFLIEYQGNHHWKQIDYFGNKLDRIQTSDTKKKKYCLEYNIPLLYITAVKNDKAPSSEDMAEIIKDFFKENIENEISN